MMEVLHRRHQHHQKRKNETYVLYERMEHEIWQILDLHSRLTQTLDQ